MRARPAQPLHQSGTGAPETVVQDVGEHHRAHHENEQHHHDNSEHIDTTPFTWIIVDRP